MKFRLYLLLLPLLLLFVSCEDPFYPESEREPMVKFTNPQMWYVEVAVCENQGSYINIFHSHNFYFDMNPPKYFTVKEGSFDVAFKARNLFGNWVGWYIPLNNYEFKNGKKYNIVFTMPEGTIANGSFNIVEEN